MKAAEVFKTFVAVITVMLVGGSGFLFAGEPEAPEPPKHALGYHLRWLDAYVATRYIYVNNRNGRVRMDDQQYKVQFKGQWRFDHKGNTYLQFRSETGNAFQPGWNYSGWGQNKSNLSLSVKDLFLGQKLGPHAEFQVGGIEFDRGAGTEVTFADDDGFQVGYRLSLTPHRAGWPERVQITVARVGEFHHPSVFARLPGLRDPNAVQLLVYQKLTESTQASGEFDRIAGVNFARAAIRWTPRAVFDRVILETIVRGSDDPSVGYGVQLARAFKRGGPWNLVLNYSHVESGVFAQGQRRILLNGDQPNLGQRLSFQVSRPLGLGLTLSSYVSRQLDQTVSVPRHDRWRFQVVLNYRFAQLLNRRPAK